MSQNGLFFEWPQRQSTIELPAGSSNGTPSASTTVIGPVTLRGPFARTWIVTSVHRPHSSRHPAEARIPGTMSLRICFVTPFSWSQPNDVNEHVRGAAEALRRRGHFVTVVAPSSRAADLLEGRRALQRGTVGDVVAIGAAVPTSLSERVALPMGVRANLAATLAIGAFDVVHGFEPGLPSLSSAALLEAETTTAATFFATEKITVPPRKNQRAKLLARVDALLGTSAGAIERASERFPGDYETIPLGVDTSAFAPAAKRKLIVVELAPGQSAVARAVLRLLRSLPDWEVVLARTAPLTRRPTIPAAVRDRARTRSLVKPDARRAVLAEASIFVPAPGGSARLAARGESERLRDRRAGEPRRPARARSRLGGATGRGRCDFARAAGTESRVTGRGRGLRSARGAARARLREGRRTATAGGARRISRR